MKRKVIMYTAMSLNGKIARANGAVDWLDELPNPDQLDYGYYDFYADIDTTIMGRSTYQQLLDWGVEFPYKDKTNYVVTRQKDLEEDDHVKFISDDHTQFIETLKQGDGKNIWIIGGSQLNTLLNNSGLLDEVYVHIMPIILPDGIDLFSAQPLEKQLSLISTKVYPTGVVELRYGVMGH